MEKRQSNNKVGLLFFFVNKFNIVTVQTKTFDYMNFLQGECDLDSQPVWVYCVLLHETAHKPECTTSCADMEFCINLPHGEQMSMKAETSKRLTKIITDKQLQNKARTPSQLIQIQSHDVPPFISQLELEEFKESVTLHPLNVAFSSF